jgi:hypothetical protein
LKETAPWTCPTCKTGTQTAFCPGCGERPLHPRDLTLRGLFDQFLAACTNVDSKVVRSFRYLVTRPGELTVAYLEGRRQPFLRPVPLFLIANVLFFAFESLCGGQVFTTPLDWHLHRQPWSGIAPQMVNDRLAEMNTTLEAYAPVFDQAVAIHARSMIIVMALCFALVPMLVFMRRDRPVALHVVFSLHLYAFMLLLLCLLTAIPAISALMGGPGFDSTALDYTLAVSLLVICAAYLFFAVRRVFEVDGLVRFLGTIALALGVGALVLGYRFFLFVVTLYTT